MSLDIETPKGQESATQEVSMIQAINDLYPKFQFITTDKSKPANVDGVLTLDGQIKAVIESKCRSASLDELRGSFKNEWLVTYEKLTKGCALAKSLCVPFVGFLYLLKSESILSIQIADEYGVFLPSIRIVRTKTQATINGGSIVRANAFIHMANAKVIK